MRLPQLLLLALVSSTNAAGWQWVDDESEAPDQGVGFERSGSSSSPTTCQPNESHLKLSLVMDDHPEETGWLLECRSQNSDGQNSNQVLWYVQAGEMQPSTANTWVERHACIDATNETCIFNMTDSAGNGLGNTDNQYGMALQTGFPGWFELTLDGTVVARHDESLAFDEQTYCLGAHCSENAGSSNQNKVNKQAQQQGKQEPPCRPVSLELILDNRPQDISFELTCSNPHNGQVAPVVIWDTSSGGTVSSPIGQPHEVVQRNACVDPETCCTFIIRDSNGDGLTKGPEGYFVFEVDGKWSLYTALDKVPFSELSKTFGGPSCPKPSAATTEQPPAVQEEEAPIVETEQQTKVASSCKGENSVKVDLSIHLDDHPEETSWSMVCSSGEGDNDDVVWSVPRGSMTTPFHHVRRSVCLSADQTCVFLLVDSQNNGIRSSDGLELAYNGKMVGQYQYQDEGDFTTKQYCLGKYCNAVHHYPEDDQDVVVETKRTPCNKNQTTTTTTTTNSSTHGGEGLAGLSSWEDEDDTGKPGLWIGLGLAIAVLVVLQGLVLQKSRQKASAAASAALATNKATGADDEVATTTSTSGNTNDDIESNGGH